MFSFGIFRRPVDSSITYSLIHLLYTECVVQMVIRMPFVSYKNKILIFVTGNIQCTMISNHNFIILSYLIFNSFVSKLIYNAFVETNFSSCTIKKIKFIYQADNGYPCALTINYGIWSLNKVWHSNVALLQNFHCVPIREEFRQKNAPTYFWP
mgnify:CR=1 FL=1